MTYRITLRPAALRALQRMPEKIAAACWEFIHGPLAENPHRVGKPLTIIITSITHRADAYRTR